MKLSKQVVNLELAKKLKELGVEQESLFYWRFDYHDYPEIVTKKNLLKGIRTKVNGIDGYSAFTVAELGEILKRAWQKITGFENEADNRAKLLIHLLENKLI